MRPITLDLDGFASFRAPAHVDFADADFFALVGPTGSGKSTVIDAMTFALYGSVPRWGRKGMVSLALAPSVHRGTVKLVFEVAGERYVVARELRRIGSGGGAVNQRAASLEKLADRAGLAAPGEQTVPLAKDLAGVNEAVEKLLGLSYEDFTQCVVLPQGKFADFLQAKPADRQEILLRLLGAEHYKQMMVKANQRSAAAGQRADTIAETLRGYADATPEAEQAARDAAAALDRLGQRVAVALPRIAEGQRELAAADDKLGRLRAEHAALSGLRVPDGVATLDADLAASRQELGRLRSAERAAEDADRAARAALAAGPRRAPLELAREHRAERARHTASLPELQEDTERGLARAERAATDASAAGAALEELRTRRDEAGKAAQAARTRAADLAAEHTRLTAVAVPAGVAELDQRLTGAAGAAVAAAEALDAAERVAAAAGAARDGAAPAAALAQAARDLADLRSARSSLTVAGAAASQARAARDEAEAALAAAEEVLSQRRAELDAARRANVAAELRPHLVAGEPCPVCEQPVAALPAALDAPAAEAAAERLALAERRVNDARAAAGRSAQVCARAEAGLGGAAERFPALARSLFRLLAGPLAGASLPAVAAVASFGPAPETRSTPETRGTPEPRGEADTLFSAGQDRSTAWDDLDDDLLAQAAAEVGALTQARDDLESSAARAAADAQAARQRQRTAADQARQAEADQASARSRLRAARDPLVALGAPAVEEAGLADGWAALTRWAADQAEARAAALDEARPAAAEAERGYRALTAEFGRQEQEVTRLGTAARAAHGEQQRTRTRLDQVTGRIAELDGLLGDAPDEEQIAARLAELSELEAAATAAERELSAARTGRAAGERATGELERAEGAARGRLTAARDQVVSLAAPAPAGQGLLRDWTDLVDWASGQAKRRAAEITQAEATAGAARAGLAKLAAELAADLAEAGVSLTPGAPPGNMPPEAVTPERVAAAAAPAVAAAAEGARNAVNRIAERRAEAAALTARQQAAAGQQQVAGMLGDLLRANQFQRWLVTETLDDLVVEASATLNALSAGQFDLAYDDGDFQVVDHADADARRSVRTLSGGETFQASLALALALSSQISALAAAGAARLDSIFLDEGFGTLDPETLEVVAATLEALAEGDRMVGVVTHVAALAERVPVRFRVARDALTSTITREGLATETAGE